jgi:predicted tellurium resistance membrane protein TerC
MEWIVSPEAWAALATLTLLEIVLGIDNIVFITILVGRLPAAQRQRARVMGLGFAMGTRILLLLLITWIMRLELPLFTVLERAISGRDLILIGGGLFLLVKATLEIHSSLEGIEHKAAQAAAAGFFAVILQIGIIDIVFSLDSVITAVGMADHVPVMIIAIILAVLVMMFAARPIGDFVDGHPTVKMLALSFLVLIGTALIAEGAHFHIPKGYIYFAMAFSVGVEMLNLRLRRKHKPAEHEPVELRKKEP